MESKKLRERMKIVEEALRAMRDEAREHVLAIKSSDIVLNRLLGSGSFAEGLSVRAHTRTHTHTRGALQKVSARTHTHAHTHTGSFAEGHTTYTHTHTGSYAECHTCAIVQIYVAAAPTLPLFRLFLSPMRV